MGLAKFHIHVDATALAPSGLNALCTGIGFEETNFCGHPEGLPHYEPNHHLTLKLDDPRVFEEQFECARAILSQPEHGFRGYLEGEFIASDVDLPQVPFNPSAAPPMSLSLTKLPEGSFRKSELHISLCKDRSDPRLLKALGASGLYGAWLPKSYGTAVIYTAQGSRRAVAEVLEHYHRYLLEVGGAVACSIKEERIARWWTSHSGVALPPVVHDPNPFSTSSRVTESRSYI